MSKIWNTALYIRLSKEDELKGESNSVSAQREILKEYVRQLPELIEYDTYVDDGFSGTNFERPAFIRMINDIHAGKINCVIVKDLSRLGRNYSKTGELITDEFARLGVRFIAINNSFDSLSDGSNALTQCITVGVTNVINESYAASTSANVRGTLNLNRKQGKFIGSFASYGYKKDPDDHHKLVIDEEAATIVRMIFDKFIGGMSIIGIAKMLNEMGIPNPSAYKRLKGYNYKHPTLSLADGLWPDSSVRRILKNEMYMGNMVQGKNRKISYKIKKNKAVSEDEWFVVENTHEPIIDKSTFEKAQAMFNKGIRKPPKRNTVDLLSGLVKCADCSRGMNKKTNKHDYGTYSYYRCITNRKMKNSACSNHTIRVDKLEKAVLVYLQTLISIAIDLDEIINKINSTPSRKKENADLNATLSAYEKERTKYLHSMADLYPDWKAGIISTEEYTLLKEELNRKKTALDVKIESLAQTINNMKTGVGSENDFIAHFKKYGNIDRLTRPMVTELIDKIMIHENGLVEINVKFSDAYKEILTYIDLNKKVS